MALIKCVECGKDISDSAAVCVHCGHPIEKVGVKQIIEKISTNKKRLLPIGIVLAIVIVVCGIIMLVNRPTGLEAEAVKYVKQLEDIVGDIEVIDAVCFSQKSFGEKEVHYNFLIVYTGKNGEGFASFSSDPELGYIGDGYNGGFADSRQQIYNNYNALNMQKTYLKYLIGEETAIDRKDAENDNKEGLIVLDVDKIK